MCIAFNIGRFRFICFNVTYMYVYFRISICNEFSNIISCVLYNLSIWLTCVILVVKIIYKVLMDILLKTLFLPLAYQKVLPNSSTEVPRRVN